MNVIAPVPPATVWPNVLKSLLLILQVVVALTLVLGTLIPFIAMPTAPGIHQKLPDGWKQPPPHR